MKSTHARIFTWSICGLVLLLPFKIAFAEDFVAPEEITQFGRTYKLAHKQSLPNGRALYEYTTNDEPVESWNSLVTFNYDRNTKVDPTRWALAVKKSLDANNPKPRYKLYSAGANGYARFIFEPDPKNSSYESNVHKSFHMDSCGLLVLQFAKKYSPSTDQSDGGKLALLTTISKDNAKDAAEMEQDGWRPVCR